MIFVNRPATSNLLCDCTIPEFQIVCVCKRVFWNCGLGFYLTIFFFHSSVVVGSFVVFRVILVPFSTEVSYWAIYTYFCNNFPLSFIWLIVCLCLTIFRWLVCTLLNDPLLMIHFEVLYAMTVICLHHQNKVIVLLQRKYKINKYEEKKEIYARTCKQIYTKK